MKYSFLTTLLITTLLSFGLKAKVTVMFHPYDDTFEAIVERFEQAEHQIDMALYNIDTSKRNPIIAYFRRDDVQQRLEKGELKVRLIFEGFERKSSNVAKMEELEELGIDVRFLGSSRKMHHKFAIVDGHHRLDPILVTGSANWSMSSHDNYNENILFFDGYESIGFAFQQEFDVLWSISKELGRAGTYRDIREMDDSFHEREDSSTEVHFNIENFEIRRNRLFKNSGDEGFVLTKQIVRAIDQADDHIKIASTRLKLRPIYNAIKRAAARGVRVDIVVTMGEYEYKYMRKNMKEEECADEFERTCSTSKNFTILLSREDFPGSEFVDVRIKFFNVNLAAYLGKQMHSKYMIVDDERVLTGSFNWSYSGEFSHIENLVILNGHDYGEVQDDFLEDFDYLWGMGREDYQAFVSKIERAAKDKKKVDCSFDPMALTFKEIDHMLSAAKRNKSSLRKVCN